MAPRRRAADVSSSTTPSPNVAKPMHVGHIRSTVIGDALYRVLKFLGHRVISDNHIGDWGTQFGMIIYGYKHFRDEAAFAAQAGRRAEPAVPAGASRWSSTTRRSTTKIPAAASSRSTKPSSALRELDAQADARRSQGAQEEHAKQLEQAKQQLAELQTRARRRCETKLAAVEADPKLRPLLADRMPTSAGRCSPKRPRCTRGDPTNRRAVASDSCRPAWPRSNAIYERLGVTFDHTLGESFYEDRLRGVVEDLADKGLARESDGAMCVFLEGQPAPMIVQKKDGAFLYATTDLATIQYRMSEWQPDAILYVVDHRQSLHFEQLFAAARLWGYDDVELQHISFGTVLGDDGRPFKTRSGTAVGLAGLLDEAVERACEIVCAKRRRPPRAAALRRRAPARSPSGSASARSSTPTSPTTAPATTCSATTRCWP